MTLMTDTWSIVGFFEGPFRQWWSAFVANLRSHPLPPGNNTWQR